MTEWDWAAVAASDYPVVVNPAWLRRDTVYCEFWSAGSDTDPWGYVGGLLTLSWDEWLKVRKTPRGEAIVMDLRKYGPAYTDTSEWYLDRGRFSIWTAASNPCFPKATLAVWSLNSGFHRIGWPSEGEKDDSSIDV